MRSLAILFVALGLAACGAAPATHSESEAASPALDAVVEFLLASAAGDFHTHGPSPGQFRDVRLGHLMTAGGDARYMLCGEVLPAQEEGRAEWIPFVTIKTSGYEQWIGAQATGYCQGSSVIWDKVDDLASVLQRRVDSLR